MILVGPNKILFNICITHYKKYTISHDNPITLEVQNTLEFISSTPHSIGWLDSDSRKKEIQENRMMRGQEIKRVLGGDP